MASTPEQSKARRRNEAEANGRTVGKYEPTGLAGKCASGTEWRREYKRILRQKAGCKTLAEIKSAAEKKRVDLKPKLKPAIHDAHVRRWKCIERWKRQFIKRKEGLSDIYIKEKLKQFGIPLEQITRELIELKREAMTAMRLPRNIKKEKKNHWKEENETITKHT